MRTIMYVLLLHVLQWCGNFKYSGEAFECNITHCIGDWYISYIHITVQHNTCNVFWNTRDVLPTSTVHKVVKHVCNFANFGRTNMIPEDKQISRDAISEPFST